MNRASLIVEEMPPAVREAVRVLRRSLGPSVRLFLFGSRVRGSGRPGSDWDVALESDKPLEWNRFAVVKQQARDAAWPYRLDVADMGRAPEPVRKAILETRVPLGSV